MNLEENALKKVIPGIKDKIDLSHLTDFSIKKLVKDSKTLNANQKKEVSFANSIDRNATILSETENSYLISIHYKVWNKERTDKITKDVSFWIPKKIANNTYDKSKLSESKANSVIKQNKANSVPLNENEHNFTKEELKQFSKELTNYFQDLGKYYDISGNDENLTIQAHIDEGELTHDHKFFNDKTKDFFKTKNINVNIVEQNREDDNPKIYSATYVINKL